MSGYSRKLSILLISYDYPPMPLWGVGNHVSTLSEYLAKRCHIFIATRNVFSLPTLRRQKNRIIIRSQNIWDKHFIINKYLDTESYVDFELLMTWNMLFSKQIIRVIKKNKSLPRIVHNHNWMTFPAAKRVADYFDTPLVSSFHFIEKQYSVTGDFPTGADLKDVLKIEKNIIEFSSSIIVFSNESKKFLTSLYPQANRKTYVVPHGIDLQGIRKTKKSKKETNQKITIVFVGRLVPEKGIEYLLESTKLILSENRNCVFWVIGEGYLREELEKRYKSKDILFFGQLDRVSLYKKYRQTDILCLPTLTESFGLVTAEAMAFGLAIITTKGENVSNLIMNGETGLTVPLIKGSGGEVEINQKILIEKLRLLIKDKKLRLTLGENAQKVSQTLFDPMRMADKTLKIYQGTYKRSIGTKFSKEPEY